MESPKELPKAGSKAKHDGEKESSLSRREFLKKSAALGGAAVAGIVGAKILNERFPLKGSEVNRTGDQKAAADFIKEAKEREEIIKVKVINPDNVEELVNYRSSPAVLASNWIAKIEPGKEISGVIVKQIEGYQEAVGDLPGTWFAFELANGRIGFVNTKYVRRVDGEELFGEDTRIYDTRTGKSFVLGQENSSQK